MSAGVPTTGWEMGAAPATLATVVAMIFGFPAAIYFAAVGVPVAAAFLYRRKARVIEVPAVLLWAEIGRPVEVRSFKSLFRRLFSLLTQLLLVGVLIFALGDPWPRRGPAARTIVVLDVSATMQTREGFLDRMDLGRRRALAALAGLPADAEAVVLLAGRNPVLAQPLTKDLAAVRQAIVGVRSQDVDGDLAGAVRTAAAFVDPARPTDVVVISDFAAEAPRVLRDGWRSPGHLRLIAVGEDRPDVAVTDFWTEPVRASETGVDTSGGDPDARRAVVTLAQHGLAGRAVPVRLSVNGRSAVSQEVTLGQGPTTVTLATHAPPGSVLELSVDSGDSLGIDDRAFAAVPAREGASVCLVTAGDPALERALRADPSVRLRVVAPADYHGPEAESVVIIDGPGVLPRPADKNAGHSAETKAVEGYLFIGTPDPFGWSDARDWVEAPPVTHWAGDHASLADLDPTLIRASLVLRLNWRLSRRFTTLVAADETPIIIEATPPSDVGLAPGGPPGSRCVYWLFDLRDTTLPRRLSFPLLLWNTIDYLSGGTAETSGPALTGRPLHLTAAARPDGQRPQPSPQVLGPTGVALGVERTAGGFVVPDTPRQGIYRSTDERGSEAYAVNLLSSRGAKSLPADRPDDATVGSNATASDKDGRGWWGRYRRLAWDSLMLAAVIFALCEWFLFHRQVVRIG